MIPLEERLDGVIAAAKLGGRIDVLMELRDWLDRKITAADKENENRRKETHEHDTRTSSDAAH
jgi:hypothetical protein